MKNPSFHNKAIIVSGITFAVFEFLIRNGNMYRNAPFVDIPSHLLGGAFFYALTKKYFPEHPYAVLTAGGLLFEAGEVAADQLMNQPPWQQDNNLKDSFGDMICNTLGGILMDAILSQNK